MPADPEDSGLKTNNILGRDYLYWKSIIFYRPENFKSTPRLDKRRCLKNHEIEICLSLTLSIIWRGFGLPQKVRFLMIICVGFVYLEEITRSVSMITCRDSFMAPFLAILN